MLLSGFLFMSTMYKFHYFICLERNQINHCRLPFLDDYRYPKNCIKYEQLSHDPPNYSTKTEEYKQFCLHATMVIDVEKQLMFALSIPASDVFCELIKLLCVTGNRMIIQNSMSIHDTIQSY
jgi:hypothetical protein